MWPDEVELSNRGNLFLSRRWRKKASLHLRFIFPSITFRKVLVAPTTFGPAEQCRIRPILGQLESVVTTSLFIIIGCALQECVVLKPFTRTRVLKFMTPLSILSPKLITMDMVTTTIVSLRVTFITVTRIVGWEIRPFGLEP